MSNPRDHYNLMAKMRAKVLVSYVESHKLLYSHKYQSKLKIDLALLSLLLRQDAATVDINQQLDNITDQLIFAEEAMGKGIQQPVAK